MKALTRRMIFILSAVIFGPLLLLAMFYMPPFGNYKGPYGDIVNRVAQPLRHSPQSVSAVNFDFRGFDTMGEEFIFFSAVTGVLLLLRPEKGEEDKRPREEAAGRKVIEQNELVSTAGILFFPIGFLFGLYIAFHGHLTPGGGFQGGVFLASGFVYIYLSGKYHDFEAFSSVHVLSFLEALGASGFVLVGLSGFLRSAPFLFNAAPLGKEGQLFSAGNLPILNMVVGTEISTGTLLILRAFLKQALVIRTK